MKGEMSHQMLNLLASPMSRDTGMKTVNTKRLVALDPDRKGKQVRLGDVAVIDFEGEERELVFYRGDSEAAQAVAALDLARAQQAGGQHNQRAA